MKQPVAYYRALARRCIESAKALGCVYGIEANGVDGERIISLFGNHRIAHAKDMPADYRPLAETDFDGHAA